MEAGQLVAYRQLPIREITNNIAAVNAPGKIKVVDKKKETDIKVTSDVVQIAFDKASGLLKEYKVNGVDLLGEGGTLKPNFWRAVTDNDMGAQLQKSSRLGAILPSTSRISMPLRLRPVRHTLLLL